MRKRAISLSETLLALLIVGVIAAMTLPVLFHGLEENDRKVAYKKSVSILSEAIQQLAVRGIGCGVIQTDEDLAKCLANVFVVGTLDDNVLITADGQSYIFHWRKGSEGLYTDCGVIPRNTEANWKGSDANCVVVIDIDGPHRGSIGYDDYSRKVDIIAPWGNDRFPMIMTLHGVRPAFYEGSLGYEYSYGQPAKISTPPWGDDSNVPPAPLPPNIE